MGFWLLLWCVFSPQSWLTDPGEPDGVAEGESVLCVTVAGILRLDPIRLVRIGEADGELTTDQPRCTRPHPA